MKKKIIAVSLLFMMVLAGCNENTSSLSVSTVSIPSKDETSATNTSVVADSTKENVESQNVEANLNDSTSMDVYSSFLKGEYSCKNVSRETALEKEKEYTVTSLAKAFSAYYLNDYLPSELSDFSYAYIDCGKDGEPELGLALSFCETGSDYPSLFEYLILKNFDGELRIVASENGYYRTEAEMNLYGVLTSYGSSGFNSHGGSQHFVNAAGEDIFLFSETELCSLEKVRVPNYLLASDIEKFDDYEEQFNDDHGYAIWYVSYINPADIEVNVSYDDYLKSFLFAFNDFDGNLVMPDEEINTFYLEHDINVYTADDLKAKLTKHLDELGATSQILERDYPEWIALDMELFK